jgi:glutamyl-tRNA reductase
MADLVIGCTGAAEILVDAETVEKVLRERKQHAMFFIDIGDRRNFDPRINELDNVYLYNLDDLKGVAEENLQERASEAAKAEGTYTKSSELCPLDRRLGTSADYHGLRQRFEEIAERKLRNRSEA